MWVWQDRGCMDKAFAVRQVGEKDLANGKDVFWHLWIWEIHIRSVGMVCARC